MWQWKRICLLKEQKQLHFIEGNCNHNEGSNNGQAKNEDDQKVTTKTIAVITMRMTVTVRKSTKLEVKAAKIDHTQH